MYGSSRGVESYPQTFSELLKLIQLDAAEALQDLRDPPGNRLEQLKNYDPLRYSVRINDQWRITFEWSGGGAQDVRIEDYH